MGKKILFIDDEAIVVTSIEKLLKKVGYSVGTAWSGREALERIRQEDFNLIICDVRMPEVNGIETVKRIRAYLRQNGKPPVPEIMVTGYASRENFKKAQELTVADYIYKPFDIKELLTSIQVTLLARAQKGKDQRRSPIAYFPASASTTTI